ncbi:pkip [Cyclophragma undans nucleopolyhedrovirus]|uniref:Pkip n=1 Tax=Cyclophragma undans nucleopolyhedrovirus TaxID=1906244 RepID=A0A288QYU2_9ABAC|nr:pkip [Cyclophragma undans nucleopolyhedrovirus]AOT85584.1 pkip [Cyclophragma undans nucleopolyhedrovirus]
MEKNLHAHLKRERVKLSDLIKLQNKSVRNYFNDNGVAIQHRDDKLLIVAADLHGCIEQIEVLHMFIDATTATKLEFVYDFTDLDIDESDIKIIHDTKKIDYFSKKYNAANVLQAHPLAYDHFLKESEHFIDTLAMYYSARQNKNFCIDELVIIKSILIKHLCTLEYLVGVNK